MATDIPADSTDKPRSRLGRGLSALLSTPVVGAATTASTSPGMEVAVENIEPNPHQPRKAMDEAQLRELADSLRSTGFIQPIVVRLIAETPGRYQLIAGERRWRAAQLAGLKTVPVIVREIDSPTQAQMALVENIQRADLNPIERAEAYRALLTQLGLTQAELSSRLGEERVTVANYLRLMDLAEPVREFVRNGQLSIGHGKVLAAIEDPASQIATAELAVKQNLTVRNLERVIATPPAESREPKRPSLHIRDLETRLARHLGLRVQVRSSGKGRGRLTLHYGSLDQFDELLNKLGVPSDE